MKYKMSDLEKAERRDARQKILDACNKFVNRPVTYTMRNIQAAVCVARYNKLVDATTLKNAGFNS